MNTYGVWNLRCVLYCGACTFSCSVLTITISLACSISRPCCNNKRLIPNVAFWNKIQYNLLFIIPLTFQTFFMSHRIVLCDVMLKTCANTTYLCHMYSLCYKNNVFVLKLTFGLGDWRGYLAATKVSLTVLYNSTDSAQVNVFWSCARWNKGAAVANVNIACPCEMSRLLVETHPC